MCYTIRKIKNGWLVYKDEDIRIIYCSHLIVANAVVYGWEDKGYRRAVEIAVHENRKG